MIATCTPTSGVPTAPMWVSWCSGRNSVVHGLISVCPNSSAKSQPKPSRQARISGVRHRRHRVDRPLQRGEVAPGERRVLQHRPVHHRQPEHLGDPLALDRGRAAPPGRSRAARGWWRRPCTAGVQNALSCAVWNIGIMRGEAVGGRPAGVERRRHRLQVDGQVARDHALRERRGARGVEVGERVAVGDLRGGRVGVLGLAVGQRDPQPVGGLGARTSRARPGSTITSVTPVALRNASPIASTSWVSTARPLAREWPST